MTPPRHYNPPPRFGLTGAPEPEFWFSGSVIAFPSGSPVELLHARFQPLRDDDIIVFANPTPQNPGVDRPPS